LSWFQVSLITIRTELQDHYDYQGDIPNII
jgi:hypothetical protein